MWQLLVGAGKRLTEVTLLLAAEEGKNARCYRQGDRLEGLGALTLWRCEGSSPLLQGTIQVEQAGWEWAAPQEEAFLSDIP